MTEPKFTYQRFEPKLIRTQNKSVPVSTALAKIPAASAKPLVAGRKVKQYLKRKDFDASEELISALSHKIECILDSAIKKAKAKKKSVITIEDMPLESTIARLRKTKKKTK
ncbi:MAG: hypothetical protein GY800_02630 [Planctomycetes bacterium]|nr:hypothetical protein [Planctomycetota bacterium]